MMDTITDSQTPSIETAVADTKSDPNPQVVERARGRRQFSANYKARILAEYDSLGDLEKGALLRREGLYSSLLSVWRSQSKAGSIKELSKSPGRKPPDPKDKEIAKLKGRVTKLESDLDKANKVIEIQGKLSALLDQFATDNAKNQIGETE